MAQAKRVKALPPQELAAYFASLAMLLRAGVPANECPGIIASDMDGSRLGKATVVVDGILNSGEVFLLSEAMQKSGAFPDYSLEMMRLGEESGRQETAADSLGEYYRHQAELNESVRSALSGPLLLLVMMAVVLFVLILFVLPVYDRVFASLGASANLGLNSAYIASRIGIGVVAVLLALFLVIGIIYILPGGRARLLRMSEVLPFTRKIHYAVSASRLTHGLQMLLASGISSSEALRKASVLVKSRQINKNMPDCIKAVEDGEDLGKALVNTGVLSGFEAKVLVSASRAGQTELAMGRLSEVYSAQANADIDRLVSVVEPALVGILSVAIGVILLAVMLPLINIMSAIN